MRPRAEHDALGESPFIEGLTLRPLTRHHEHDADGGAAQVTHVSPQAGERLQRLGLAHDDDLTELTVACAARPARHLENVLHDRVRHGLALEFANRTEAAQKIGQRLRWSIDGHRFSAYQCLRRECPVLSWFRKTSASMLAPLPRRRR